MTDDYCGTHCNPYNFPKLMYTDASGDDQWYFNTSVTEQTNAWFGRYHTICCEMGGIFYEFFLNQLILMHNEEKKTELENNGFNPTYWAV